jgi:hypothetical protein
MVLRLLADHRIQADIEDNANENPLMVARRWSHTEIALRLQLHVGL